MQQTQQPTQKTSQTTDTASQTAEQSSPQLLAKAPQRVGEAISLKDKDLDVQVTVHGTRQHQGKGVIKPNQGQKWIVVDTTIANQGKQPRSVSVVSFKLLDSANNSYEVALLAAALDDVESPTGQIAPGEKRRGEVAFEVPDNAKGLKLVFQPNRSACEATPSQQKATLSCESVAVKLK